MPPSKLLAGIPSPIALAVKRVRSLLRGKDKIGLRVGREIDAHKMAKHFQIEITDANLT